MRATLRFAAVATSVLVAGSLASATAGTGSTLGFAERIVRTHGYVPNASDWNPGSQSNVLTSVFARSADGYNQRAFFFYGRRYLGTDASEPSARVQAMWSDGTTVALTYVLYRRADPNCCPSGGGKIVRFRWTGRRVVALDPIPTRDWRAPLHR